MAEQEKHFRCTEVLSGRIRSGRMKVEDHVLNGDGGAEGMGKGSNDGEKYNRRDGMDLVGLLLVSCNGKSLSHM